MNLSERKVLADLSLLSFAFKNGIAKQTKYTTLSFVFIGLVK